MHIGYHIARGWNKVPGSLLTCHKSLSRHFDYVGLTHSLLTYLSTYKKREGSENATQHWEAKENVKASWGQAIIVFGKTKLTKPNLLQREGIGIIRSSKITFILTPPITNYYHQTKNIYICLEFMLSKWYHHGLLIIQHAEDPVIYTCDFCGREWKHKLMFRKLCRNSGQTFEHEKQWE